MAYDYIRQFEVDQSTIPVGHYDLATCSWSKSSRTINFQVDMPSDAQGIIEVDLTNSAYGEGKAKLYISIHYGTPKNYTVEAATHHYLPESVKYITETGTNVSRCSFEITFTELMRVHVRTQIANTTISESTVVPATELLERGRTLSLLTEGVDFGTLSDRPSAGHKGRIFFVKVE